MTYSNTPLVIAFTGYTYTYGSTHKHAVTALSSGESYTYDANGNMITRVEGGKTYTQSFNAENRLIAVTVDGATTHFIYDYTDPTGHMIDDGCKDYGCGSSTPIDYDYTPGNNKNDDDDDEDDGGGPNDELVKTLNEFAIGAQDVATYIDFAFGTLEFGMAAGGCLATIEIGCVEGGLAGLILGQATFNLSGANAMETILSLASLVFTVAADGLDDGQLGEASLTSAVTFGVGTMMIDPIADFAVDGYASGYNHGVFNGIGTIFNGGSFFQDSFLDLVIYNPDR